MDASAYKVVLNHQRPTFLSSVLSGVYEKAALPKVINLLEIDPRTKDNILQVCLKKNYFITFNKILCSHHPAILLLLNKKDVNGHTMLESLLEEYKENINPNIEKFVIPILGAMKKNLSPVEYARTTDKINNATLKNLIINNSLLPDLQDELQRYKVNYLSRPDNQNNSSNSNNQYLFPEDTIITMKMY